jgi:uncharacterized protein (TIGR03643 family)
MIKKNEILTEGEASELIHMALSDHVSFEAIRTMFNLTPDEIKKVMKSRLAPGSYKAWRKRVSAFSRQRAFYK